MDRDSRWSSEKGVRWLSVQSSSTVRNTNLWGILMTAVANCKLAFFVCGWLVRLVKCYLFPVKTVFVLSNSFRCCTMVNRGSDIVSFHESSFLVKNSCQLQWVALSNQLVKGMHRCRGSDWLMVNPPWIDTELFLWDKVIVFLIMQCFPCTY